MRNNNYTDKNGVQHYGMDVLVERVEFVPKDGGQEQQQPQRQAPSPPVYKNQSKANSRPQPQQSYPDGNYEEILDDGEILF